MYFIFMAKLRLNDKKDDIFPNQEIKKLLKKLDRTRVEDN